MFYLVSDLKANFSKNRFGAIGLDVSIVAQCVELLNCKLHLLSFLYLGILSDANSRRKETWEPIIAREAYEKIVLLEAKYFVHFQESVPYQFSFVFFGYLLSFYKMPIRRVRRKLVSIQTRFLWGGVEGEKKSLGYLEEYVCY